MSDSDDLDRRADSLFRLMRHAFMAGCEAFEGKSPWATAEDLFQRYVEDIAKGADLS